MLLKTTWIVVNDFNDVTLVINVVGNTALARQKDPTDIAPLKTVWFFLSGRVNAPNILILLCLKWCLQNLGREIDDIHWGNHFCDTPFGVDIACKLRHTGVQITHEQIHH